MYYVLRSTMIWWLRSRIRRALKQTTMMGKKGSLIYFYLFIRLLTYIFCFFLHVVIFSLYRKCVARVQINISNNNEKETAVFFDPGVFLLISLNIIWPLLCMVGLSLLFLIIIEGTTYLLYFLCKHPVFY